MFWRRGLKRLASWALAFAYFISVAYYLNLFGAFGVSLTPVNDDQHAKLLTSAIFLLILAVGWTRGFKALERMEQVSVGIKLAIIAGLIFGLGGYFFQQAGSGESGARPSGIDRLGGRRRGVRADRHGAGVRDVALSRRQLSGKTRIRSMLWAQAHLER